MHNLGPIATGLRTNARKSFRVLLTKYFAALSLLTHASDGHSCITNVARAPTDGAACAKIHPLVDIARRSLQHTVTSRQVPALTFDRRIND